MGFGVWGLGFSISEVPLAYVLTPAEKPLSRPAARRASFEGLGFRVYGSGFRV